MERGVQPGNRCSWDMGVPPGHGRGCHRDMKAEGGQSLFLLFWDCVLGLAGSGAPLLGL